MTKVRAKTKTRRKIDFEKVVFLPDLHIPFHDTETIASVIKFLKDFQPDHIFLLGDLLDFYDLSTFDKDPERRFKLQEEIDTAVRFLEVVRKTCPLARIIYMQGNHEDRLRRWLWRNQDISSLEALDLKTLLHLKRLDIKTYKYGDVSFFHGFAIKHGDLVRKNASYTARAELNKVGISGISGHTHRLGSCFKRDHSGQKVWYEAGCLCELEPEYDKTPDWQQGFAIGLFERVGNRFYVTSIPIIKNRFMVADRYYSP